MRDVHNLITEGNILLRYLTLRGEKSQEITLKKSNVMLKGNFAFQCSFKKKKKKNPLTSRHKN